jgi:hypothetical protein
MTLKPFSQLQIPSSCVVHLISKVSNMLQKNVTLLTTIVIEIPNPRMWTFKDNLKKYKYHCRMEYDNMI